MGSSVVSILIALIGAGGLSGGIVALLKIRPEANTAAVTQAQGAMETMQDLNEAMKAEIDRARKTNEELQKICDERADRLEASGKMITQLQEMISGMMVMDNDNLFPPKPKPPPET